MFRTSIKAAVRGVHTLPQIGLDASKGIPGLFSPKGLDVAWFQYQKYVLDNLNRALKQAPEYTGQQFETPSSVMVAAVRDASQSEQIREVARWASLAYSNEFFFQSLGPENRNKDATFGEVPLKVCLDPLQNVETMPPVEETGATVYNPLQTLYGQIKSSFDSQQALRELVTSRGSAMFGNGFLWMIENSSELHVLNTFNWGSPQSQSKSKDAPGTNSPVHIQTNNEIDSPRPLLAINMWQHVYLHDYGVAGKHNFICNVFDTINWERVASRLRLD